VNIVLINIDTLRADHLGCYGYRRNTSPNLDKLAEDGVICENLFCPAIPTQPSHTTMFSGQYSITHQIVTHGGNVNLAPNSPWLQSELLKTGYTTCAVDNLWKMKPWFNRGYEFYIDPSHRHTYIHSITADVINARALEWIKNHANEKFFIFIHYWEPHTPYIPPERLRSLFYSGNPCDPKNQSLKALDRQPFGDWWRNGWFKQLQAESITDIEYIIAMYDSEVRFADEAIGELLELLDQTGLAEDTLIWVMSDHGELLGEHDIFFDHHGLYEGNIHVPMILRWPKGGLVGGRRVRNLFQHIDFAPTILSAAGVKVPEAMEGANLLPWLRGERNDDIYEHLITQECTWQAKWALRTSEYKFILAREPDLHNMPMRELYNLKEDPEENHNLYLEDHKLAFELEGELESWLKKMLEKNGLSEDPVKSQGITLGKSWHNWVEKQRYW
jgi:arylsulfatase A-like enzyme